MCACVFIFRSADVRHECLLLGVVVFWLFCHWADMPKKKKKERMAASVLACVHPHAQIFVYLFSSQVCMWVHAHICVRVFLTTGVCSCGSRRGRVLECARSWRNGIAREHACVCLDAGICFNAGVGVIFPRLCRFFFFFFFFAWRSSKAPGAQIGLSCDVALQFPAACIHCICHE